MTKSLVSLCLWPIAMMSSFSLRTQTVNGCWDYAMAPQTPFLLSCPPFSSPTPLQTGASQIRHSCTFQSDAFECDVSSAHALAPMREQNRGFVSLRSLPSPGPRTCPAGGKVVKIYNRLSGLQLQCVRLVKTHVFHLLR